MTKTHYLPQAGLFLSLALTAFALPASGQIFVSVPENNTILQFTASGGTPATFASGLNLPYGLGFDNSGLLYVANAGAGNNTIVKFPAVPTPGGSESGSVFVPTIGGGLFTPYGLAFDNAGLLYVANSGSSTIKTYPGGTTYASTGLNIPYGMTFDNAGNLYVANGGNNTIEFYPSGGGSPSVFASGLSSPNVRAMTWKAGILYVAGGSGTSAVLEFTATGNSTGTSLPSTFTGVSDQRSLAFDGSGNLYVATGNNKLTKFNSSGTLLWTADTGGTPAFIAIQSECAPAVMTIAQYAGVTVAGSIGCTYRIDYTTSLNTPVTWTPLVTNTLVSSPFLFIDTNVVSGSRFYQAVAQ